MCPEIIDNVDSSECLNYRRLPVWFKQNIPGKKSIEKLQKLSENNLNTVCVSAMCPNLSACFKNNELTFMILGDTCTRNCLFCAVKKSKLEDLGVDEGEPKRVACAVKEFGLKYTVITSVTRDDLEDGGSQHFAKTIEEIRNISPQTKIEVLIPDFQGKFSSLKRVLGALPNVIAHNIETVRRLSIKIRPLSDYDRSLRVLDMIKRMAQSIVTKSSIMLGLGETQEEVFGALKDLHNVNCDVVTMGQYLAPSVNHYPVKEFVPIGQFAKYKDMAYSLGFKAVLSGPLVRSSYEAERVYGQV